MPDRFPTSTFGFILLLTAPVSALADPLLSVEDEEPNDTVATATATGLVDLGTAIVAGAEVGNGPLAEADRDLFWFEVTAEARLPALLTVAFDGADAAYDGYVRLFDGAGVQLLNHDDAGYPDELSPLLQTYVVVPGIYYVGVSHAMNPGYDATDDQTGRPAETGGYDLAIILSEITPPDSSLEPNDDEPTEIDSFPALITNQFIGDGPDPARDVDQYGFDVEGPAIVIAEVRPTQLGLLDPLLESRILANESLRSDTKIKRLEIAIFEAGAVRISVKSWFRSGQDTYGFYDLFVDVRPVSAADGPYEPNDSLLEATQTGLSGPGSANFAAHIGDGVFGELRGDVDFYELTLGFDELLEVDVLPTGEPPSLTPVVHLYDFLGSHVAIWMPNESGSVHGSFQRRCADVRQLPGEEPENYVLAVMGAGDRVTMDPLIPNPESPGWPWDVRFALYALDGGAGSTGAYDAGFTISSNPLADCVREPDDKIPDAGVSVLIDEGEFLCVSGMIGDGACSAGEQDVDFFRVTVDTPPADLDIRLTSTACQSSLGAAVLRVFDAPGNELTCADAPPACRRAPPHADVSVRFTIEDPGDYFVGVSAAGNDDYDPFFACSGVGESSGPYELEIRLIRQGSGEGGMARGKVGLDDDSGRLFATRLDSYANTIVELDPETGEVISELDPPEAPFGGGEGLAFDDTDLFLLGSSSRYPHLYRLDADTGEVVERVIAWFGSGVYGDMVALGEKLYVTDLLDDAIYVLSAGLSGAVQRLEMGLTNGVTLFGPLAGALRPDRLFASDAFDPSIVYEVDPETGVVLSSFGAASACGCDADFDVDGDVDNDDEVFFDDCDEVSGVSFGCQPADLNCDGDINEDDRAIFECQQNGPDVPPNSDCCPEELPPVSVRATSLAGTGRNVLFTADWTQPVLNRFDRRGNARGTSVLDAPVGKMAGVPLVTFADWDFDGDVDLIDWAFFQICFTGEDVTPYEAGCETFDFDLDEDVDLFDFSEFQEVFGGPGQ